MEFTGLRINLGICSKCSEDLSQSCKRSTEVWCRSRRWSCACWMLSWTGCCTQPGTAAVTSVPVVWLLVPFHTALLLPSRRTQTWEKTFAQLPVQWEFPAVTALTNRGTSSQHFRPSLLGSSCTWIYVLPAKPHMLVLFLMEVIFHQVLVFHNWCNRRHKHWQEWSLLEHKDHPVMHKPHSITSLSAPVPGSIAGI